MLDEPFSGLDSGISPLINFLRDVKKRFGIVSFLQTQSTDLAEKLHKHENVDLIFFDSTVITNEGSFGFDIGRLNPNLKIRN